MVCDCNNYFRPCFQLVAMPALKVKSMIKCGILLIFMIVALQYSVQIIHSTALNNILSFFNPPEKAFDMNLKKLSDLQALDPAQFVNQSDVTCMKATIGSLSFPMCIYSAEEDIYISKGMADGQYFESDLVQKVLSFFRMNPDVSFVDLGANIGIYSLPIAHSGIHVVSVEPNKDTVRRLAKSVHLGRIEKNVDILHYALSNEESTTFLKFDASNRGDTYMAGNGSCPGCLSAKVTVLNKLIPFIRHKKAFIKIDTQEAEIMIFQERSAAKFFEEINVVMIQMEWDFYPKRYGMTEDRRRKVDRFLEFFYQRSYDVYDPKTEQKLNATWTTWTYDIIFKRADLPNNQLYLI